MPSTKPGHISLDGIEYVLVEETYTKQIQTPFSPRFSTGQIDVGDLSFFQFIAMEDFSGGNGQEIFDITNRFFDSEGIDVTKPGEFKLAPKIELLAPVNGPQHEHLNEPIEEEDSWPQIIEWLGKAVIYNDRIEYDGGGTDFLEVYDTEVLRDRVINHDTSGQSGIITNDTRAEIIDIDKVEGLPGDTFRVTAKFTNSRFIIRSFPSSLTFPTPFQQNYKIEYRLDFGGEEEIQTETFSIETMIYDRALFSINSLGDNQYEAILNSSVTIEFLVRVPEKEPGIYKLWTSASLLSTSELPREMLGSYRDTLSNANVLFFIQSVDEIIVERKNLYAPQLKAATVINDKLVGGRVYDGTAYLEVYAFQNDAVDRILQINLTANSTIPAPPQYMALIGSNDVVIAAFDNKIYKIDILTAGLTDAQRITAIGTVPGSYVSGMALWNQRIYIGSFSKDLFTSIISWTNGEVIQGSYAIDGKFWITDMANFNGALFYSGGDQDGIGRVSAFPNETILEFEHPEFDNRIRSLNAGRFLYAGWSHGTGLGVITDRGVSTWARIDLGSEATNVIWDIEEVGNTVYILANNGFFKTTYRYLSEGFLETSQIGANSPLIDKDWSKVKIQLKERLAGDHRIKVWATNSLNPESLFLLGEMNVESEIEEEFSFPPDFTSQWVVIRLELFTDDETTTPIIKKISLKYLPSSLQKLQWAFGIRAYDNIKLLDGTQEKRTGSEILSNLFDLRTKGFMKFRDIDEQEYDVIVADMKQTNPVINKSSLEGLVTVELLEL